MGNLTASSDEKVVVALVGGQQLTLNHMLKISDCDRRPNRPLVRTSHATTGHDGVGHW